MKRNKVINFFPLLLLAAIAIPECHKEPAVQDEEPAPPTRIVGADLSQWLVYKENGAVYTEKGKSIDDIPAFLAEHGYNTARIRLFVAPDLQSEACQDLDYVLKTARACKQAGMQICLDFHYSDTWADPGKQYTPRAWASLDSTQLAQQVYDYTRQSLLSLQKQGITPYQIQIGNEITTGMLWETGRVSVWDEPANTPGQWRKLVSLLQNASKACREVCPDAQIIIHTDRGGDAETARRFYEKVKTVNYDVIGLSYYPFWHGTLDSLENTLRVLQEEFPDKSVMIVETAYPHSESDYNSEGNTACSYSFSPEGQQAFLSDLVETLQRHDNVTGVFYWYPEETLVAPFYGRIDLHRGLFDEQTGEVLPAIDCLKVFL